MVNNPHLEEGDAYYYAFDNDRALAEYQLAFTQEPNNPQVLGRLIRVYNDYGRILLHRDKKAEEFYRKAIPCADSLLRLAPSDPAAHFWSALSKGGLIQFVGVKEKIRLGKEVRDHANLSLRLDSTFSYPYVLLAVFEREAAKLNWLERTVARIVFGEDLSGSFRTAERYLKKAIVLDPENATAYFELGWTYLAMDDKTRAIAAFRRVCGIAPRNARDRIQKSETEEKLMQLL
ncbi:MAG: tetratricopeptide repeat protein [Ignavibacteriales bacterium]|nr:tetratricopeptide repeat protein [Ignavibacteriales bacterium]